MRQRLEGSKFKASMGKNIYETPSQPLTRCGGICLSSQICEEAIIGGL